MVGRRRVSRIVAVLFDGVLVGTSRRSQAALLLRRLRLQFGGICDCWLLDVLRDIEFERKQFFMD